MHVAALVMQRDAAAERDAPQTTLPRVDSELTLYSPSPTSPTFKKSLEKVDEQHIEHVERADRAEPTSHDFALTRTETLSQVETHPGPFPDLQLATIPTREEEDTYGPPPDGGREAWLAVLSGALLFFTMFGFEELGTWIGVLWTAISPPILAGPVVSGVLIEKAGDAYPHIIDAILAYAPHDALATLRTVCRSWQDRADARLLTHVILQDNYVPALPAGGPIRTNWSTFPVHTLDLVDLDLASPRPLPPKVHILRVRSIARWSTLSLPRSNTLVIKGLISDGGFGPTLRTWAPYLSHTTRLVAHYDSSTPELGAWGIIGGSLRLSCSLSCLSSSSLQEIVFVFTGVADAIDLSLLGPLVMLCMQLGWHSGEPTKVRMTLVNVLPFLAAGVEAGEALTGESEDVHALFFRAAGFGPAPDDQLKRDFGHYFDFVTFDEYRQRVGDEQFELEMGVPRRVGPLQLLQPIPPRDEKIVRFARIQ
ncbi:hypothetical protein CspHIS471_0700700 [Cutaneotrichosporon sp. HIS471]|nr:hypothetical protein CspHIS471_0700700 [Cutaneotrichosporon sp. HIS471]